MILWCFNQVYVARSSLCHDEMVLATRAVISPGPRQIDWREFSFRPLLPASLCKDRTAAATLDGFHLRVIYIYTKGEGQL